MHRRVCGSISGSSRWTRLHPLSRDVRASSNDPGDTTSPSRNHCSHFTRLSLPGLGPSITLASPLGAWIHAPFPAPRAQRKLFYEESSQSHSSVSWLLLKLVIPALGHLLRTPWIPCLKGGSPACADFLCNAFKGSNHFIMSTFSGRLYHKYKSRIRAGLCLSCPCLTSKAQLSAKLNKYLPTK